MLPTASGRWILVYEGANTVSEQTFHSLQCLFYGVNYAAARIDSSELQLALTCCLT
jgi:hypothetical protein